MDVKENAGLTNLNIRAPIAPVTEALNEKVKRAVLNELTVPVPIAGLALGLKSRASAYRAAKAGEIPTIPIGGRRVVSCAALREMLGLKGGIA
jgi:hypothetical protein